jgi:hypothetical protein
VFPETNNGKEETLILKRVFVCLTCIILCDFALLPGSVVGITTSYGLDGPGIESRWGARFSAPVQTGPGDHPASCTMGTGSFPGVKSGPVRDADPSPPSSAAGHERVVLYLYSPYGPYGLCRTSVPVQGRPLPFYRLNNPTYLLSVSSIVHFKVIFFPQSFYN